MENWPDNLAKQWDVCCKWSFKNKHKIYGSPQFESCYQAFQSLQAAKTKDELRSLYNSRYAYFNSVVEELQEYN